MKKTSFLLLALQALLAPLFSQTLNPAIRLNQLGFYPAAQKTAVVAAVASGEFQVFTADLQQKVYTGTLRGPQRSNLSNKTTRIADFSDFKKPGKYVLVVPSMGHSHPFEIKDKVYLPLAIASLKAFYHQRMSTPLPAQYAGIWNRAAGHPDRHVLVHPSAATSERPAQMAIASPGGWYDAGDYNKYIVNSGITTGTLLSLYEDFPAFFKHLETNIPESANGVPDLLDESLYNIRWMLTMQDPLDGGVYHKCTTAKFEGFVKPSEANDLRYVVQKSTAATLDFAAVMAQSARVFRDFSADFPGLADSCLLASKAAWRWAKANPAVLYDQDKLNLQFEPDILTGAYGDNELTDEFIWAAVELYVTTSEEAYLLSVELFPVEIITVPSWSDVRTLAYNTLLRTGDNLTQAGRDGLPFLKNMYLGFARGIVFGTEGQAYLTPMENSADNFVWGSSAVCANQAISLLYAYRISAEPSFLHYALDNLDYLLGRNATGYSYVTGFGSKTPMHPHHRPSEADGVEAPVPGLLVGGPNPGQQDKCTTYPNKFPDESYTDDVCSYASNEVAINWNAPLAYLAFGLEALMDKK